ncbi:MAG: Xaa-Pro peptidase family protein [Actinobacteria bacterium]|nr:Xaa-Pro peptidase family protein [Actinomycetota bacterium]
MDVPGRLPRLRQSMEEHGCDALLVTSLTNLRYLTGFTGSAGMLLVLADGSLLLTDGRYDTQAAEQVQVAGVEAAIEVGNGPRQDEVLVAAVSAVSRLGLEACHTSWARQRTLADKVPSATELVPTEGLVETQRIVKDEGELDRMAKAAAIADQALVEVRPRLLDRPTEREFALELDSAIRRLGADDVSFDTIVAAGPNGAKPHARPTDRRIEPGELLVLDFGALLDGYHSDMTRTVCVGPPGTRTRSRMVEAVMAAQAAGVAAVRGGAAARDVDAACREIITQAGWGDAFVHGTGHGVGLDIHEQPMLSAVATATLAAGSVVTVEPGVYLRGEGGVRIEDSLVVTDDGCRHLTKSPKDLVID